MEKPAHDLMVLMQSFDWRSGVGQSSDGWYYYFERDGETISNDIPYNNESDAWEALWSANQQSASSND